ncbi:hypothetical protein NDS46_30305 (plasmid) [Paenibacillus thiaminolyticus]|uniref:hypothetical protein n=1 Tax=Paenibacillus thiaminolyticus TaxID=49283 RepID=UPI00233057BD|nr:hypothetical protein [Paenibacillus thiaminolyticus]WCF11641.1 hypothetical protein NDS46_30305 [Paenibacillus thiaminolyticus]
MRKYPTDKYELEELEELNAEPWMVEMLKKNPDYVWWGNFEDYMIKDTSGWDSRKTFDTVDEGLWELDELNELINFYFEVNRKYIQCDSCDSTGYNLETKKIADDWYDLTNTGRRWCSDITQDEVDVLWDNSRLKCTFKEKPTAEQVNSRFEHDGINRSICIEQRAKRLGVYGFCSECNGRGFIYTEDEAKLSLQLWIIHPRKGSSRGVFIKEVKKHEIDRVIKHLKEAKERNNERFSRL